MEVADYYRRHGSLSFGCTLDAFKGFDRCNWKVIFRRLFNRQLPAVASRIIMFIYLEQKAWVVWGPSRRCSSFFRLTNRTRQGSVISPNYCQDLLDWLRALGIGYNLPGKPFIYEAIESSLVPEGFLTAQFLQKL